MTSTEFRCFFRSGKIQHQEIPQENVSQPRLSRAPQKKFVYTKLGPEWGEAVSHPVFIEGVLFNAESYLR
jgi:hypothetical protein